MPSKEDFKRMWAPILRGTALGSMPGILPGGGALARVLRRLIRWEEGLQYGTSSAKARSRASRRPSRPTTPARRLLHPDADARHPGQRGHGAQIGRAMIQASRRGRR